MKTLGILTIKSEYESVKRLGFDTYLRDDYDDYCDKEIVIRWGNSFALTSPKNKVYNKAQAIALNCYKYESKKKLGEVVNIPRLFKDKIPEGALAVVRPVEHTGGQNFKVVKGPYNLDNEEYGSEFVKTEKEFRVWFAGNALLTARRIKMKCNETTEYPCRSEWGYAYTENFPVLSKETLKAKKAIGLDFGCADVLRHNNQYYFLELNSAPSIDHSVVEEFYRGEINKLIKT
ncbi:MAG: hypothetical protein EKK57_09435 [Proteobacteria bacterium]|nr:MAG: hypothetical protein EKK57_09435 [Pseudomonadota bacterium]